MVQLKKFSIFKPYPFYWTRTYNSYAFILAVILIVLILKFLTNVLEFHPAFKFLYFAPLLPYIYRLALFFIVRNSYRPLKGKLEGYINFNKDAIEIDTEIYNLSDIRKIELKTGDYLGLEIGYRSFSDYFEDTFSQGVDNLLILHLNNNTTVKTRFQQLEACELRQIEDIILEYYLKGKISYLQTVEILCLSSSDEWSKLKQLKN